MVSSIGGTMGMCIGFSFVWLSSFVLGHLQNFIGNLFGKKSKSEIGVLHNNVIKVENAPYYSEEMERSNQLEIRID